VKFVYLLFLLYVIVKFANCYNHLNPTYKRIKHNLIKF